MISVLITGYLAGYCLALLLDNKYIKEELIWK